MDKSKSKMYVNLGSEAIRNIFITPDGQLTITIPWLMQLKLCFEWANIYPKKFNYLQLIDTNDMKTNFAFVPKNVHFWPIMWLD